MEKTTRKTIKMIETGATDTIEMGVTEGGRMTAKRSSSSQGMLKPRMSHERSSLSLDNSLSGQMCEV